MPYDPDTGDWIEDPVDPPAEPPKPPKPTGADNWRRQMEQRVADAEAKAAAAAAAEAERDAAKRELLMVRAGIDVESGTGKLFARAYDGDLTADAIKAAATEYGVISAPGPSAPAGELAAHTVASTAAAGAVPTTDSGWSSELDAVPMVKDGQWNPEYEREVLGLVNKHGGQRGAGEVTKWSSDGGQTWTAEPELARGQG